MSDFLFGEDHDMPQAKSFSEAYSEGISALKNSMPQIYATDAFYTPLFNDIFRSEQSDSLSEYNKDLWDLQLEAYQKYAPALASAQLAYEKEYTPQFTAAQIANQRLADPTYWAIRDALGAQVESDLAKGNTLSDAQRRQVEQSSRASMASRGGSSAGYAPAAQEVLGEFLASEGIKASRQNAATNFLSLGANNPATAPSVNVATNGYSTLTPYMYSNAAQAGNNAVNYNNGIYNQQVQWAQNENNQPSPFSTLMGTVMGGVGSGAMAYNAFKN